MALSDHVDLSGFIEGVKRRNPGQPEFVQAVTEVAEDIFDFIQDKEQYHKYQILRRIAEPDLKVLHAMGSPITTRPGTAPWSGQDNTTDRPVAELKAEATPPDLR